jgi:hypothetical protein
VTDDKIFEVSIDTVASNMTNLSYFFFFFSDSVIIIC